MSMNKRPGFFARLLAVITGAGKPPLQDVEETPPSSEEPEIASVGLPGSKWEFGCSAGAATEIASNYDEPTHMSGDNGA